MQRMDTNITRGAPFTQAKQVFIIYLKGTACSSAACNYPMGILLISLIDCLNTTKSLMFKVLLEIHKKLRGLKWVSSTAVPKLHPKHVCSC